MNGWYSVHDVLPARGAKGDFLVWINNGKTQFAGVYSFDRDKWDLLNITHWRPLPAAPEVEE